MPRPNLILCFDVENRQLVAARGGTVDLTNLLRAVYQVRVYLVKPRSSSNAINVTYEKFDPTGYDGIRLGIWTSSEGTDETQLTLTDQTGWAYNTDDADNPYWSGQLNLLTAAVTSALGTEATLDAYLACNLVSGADLVNVFDQTGGNTNCTIQQKTDPGSGIGVSMTTGVPTITLPCRFVKDGNVYLADLNMAGDALVLSAI